MSRTVHLPMLDQIQVASPCSARWEDMTGDAKRRHCAECDLDVHNISEMTREEAETLLLKLSEGRVCARFYRRRDGTILTKDCPIGIRAARIKVLKLTARVAAALGLAVLAGAAAKAAQDTNWGNYGWSMRLSNVYPVQWMREKLSAMGIRGGTSSYLGGAVAGRIAMPPGTPPPSRTPNQGAYGPHPWEYNQ